MLDYKLLMRKMDEALARAQEVLDKAIEEDRDMTDEEQAEYDEARKTATRYESLAKEAQEIEGKRSGNPTGDPTPPVRPQMGDPEPSGPTQTRERPRGTEEYRKAFHVFLRNGAPGLGAEELRALQADSDPAGGYVVAPEQLVQEILKAVDDKVYIRQFATKYMVERADSLGVPSLDADPADADWTNELGTGSEDSTMAFGKRTFHPHPLAKRIKVSNKLLRSSFLDVEQLVRDRLAYKFSISQEKGFLTGSGAMQPLGVFTASDNGIPTSRDVSTGNTTTSIQVDGLIEAKYALKQQYWPNAFWIFHRDAQKQISKLKDGEGQYLWRESTRVGEPDRLLGFPVYMSEYAPNTFTTGQYVGILGDFRFYWIADAMDMQVQRLMELYAESNQIGLIGRLETDGMPVLSEAFVRVKLA
jgi:HK97 family phage major capsid protein